jgi:hypothetical protein
MATVRNILIDQNADYLETFTAKDDTGTIIDLTGKTVSGKLRKAYASTTSTTFSAVTVSDTAGTYTLSLTDVQTGYGTLDRGRYVYDVITTLTASPTTITRIQQGIATVSPSVTRADPA